MKVPSLKNIIKSQNIGIFCIQETHFVKKGKIQIENFHIFESIRKNKEKGGSLIGVHQSLSPVLIQEYNESFELIVIEIKVNDKEIRVITGYGPQEGWKEEERSQFFIALEKEVVSAEIANKSVIIEMDANSKLGPIVIDGDPHPQSSNGKMLADIIEKHGMIVVNGLKTKRRGLITREKCTIRSVEKSIIDLVIVSADLLDDIVNIHIDEEKEYALSKIIKTKNGTKVVNSDHNSIFTSFKFQYTTSQINPKIEIYNLKNKECQKRFFEETNNTNSLSKIFDTDKDLSVQTKKFIKRLEGFVKKCFRKIKIGTKTDKNIDLLFNERRILKCKTDTESKIKLEQIEQILAEKIGDSMYKQVEKEVEGIDGETGGNFSGKFWKLRKKLFPRSVEPPTAMKDEFGNVVTSPSDIIKETIKHYTNLFDTKPINESFSHIVNNVEKLCEQNVENAYLNKTPPWTMDELTSVLKSLKNEKSADPYGFINEIFKPNVAGHDLKLAILKMVNRIKEEGMIPEVLKYCNISSIFKNKGSKSDFSAYRGIFRVTIMRYIVDRLIYNDEYDTIDNYLSDCNVGSRKHRNIRDNLFVVYAVMNSVRHGNEDPVDFAVYDVKQCFDSMWAQSCINDLYRAGLNNDKLKILHSENLSAQVAFKTNNGISDRINISNVIMQGTVWGGLYCTTMMNSLGEISYNDPNIYKYRGVVPIPTLQMVDDILGIQKCDNSMVIQNSYINSFIESRRQKFCENKCSRLHIGKHNKKGGCPELYIHNIKMKNSLKEKYLGDILSSSGNPHLTVLDRISRGYGIIGEIMSILDEIPTGRKRIKIGLLLRQSWFLNSILLNSESWHSITDTDIEKLTILDNCLMRYILGAHSKVPTEMLFLETAAIPIKYVIKCRRMIYLKEILDRKDNEIINKIYYTQKANPLKGDWWLLVQEDFNFICENINEDFIINMKTVEYKKYIKSKIRHAVFNILKSAQTTHQKVNNIYYNTFNSPQPYITHPLFTNDLCSLLFNLRCKTVTGIKDNFPSQYQTDMLCPLCLAETDTLKHCLQCPVISNQYYDMKYEDIFGTVTQQLQVTKRYKYLLEKRASLLSPDEQGYPAIPRDPGLDAPALD